MWMTTRSSNALHQLDLPVGGAGWDLLRYALGQGSWATDLAYANGIFYVPEYLGPIHKIDANTGLELGTIPSPNDFVYGLTFDGQNLLASAGADSDRIWSVSPEDGSIRGEWHTGMSSMVGLAYDISSRTLYIGDYDRVTVAQMVPEPSPLTLLFLMAGGSVMLSRCFASLRKE